MKNIILTLLLTALLFPISAQQRVKETEPNFYGEASTIEYPNFKVQSLRRGQGYSGWFNHTQIIDAICSDPANLQGFVGLMSYDSNLVLVNAEGTQFHAFNHMVGTIVDPTDPDWNEMANPIPENQIYNRHVKYTLDSIQFPYVYIRNTDSMMINGTNKHIVDTLFVVYYLDNHYRDYRFGEEYGMVPDSLNESKCFGNAYEKIDTVLLVEDYATEKTAENTYRYANMRLFADIKNDFPDGSLPTFRTGTHNDWSKNTVGYSMTFKSMKPTVLGDTMTANDGSIVTNLHNFFGFSYFSDQNPKDAQVANEEHLNGSFKVTKYQRYGGAQNGWKGFILMRAYFEKQYQNVNFKLKAGTHDVALENMNKNGYGVDQVYPNPTNGMGYLSIKLKKANSVKLDIFNISGQKVISNITFANNGNSIISFNTNNLDKGIYLANITIDKNTFTRKFIVE